MLFMCFVYYQIAKLYKVKPEECKDLMIFTGKIQDHIDKHERKISAGEESLLAPLQKFSLENERTIMGLFLTIKCTRTEIKSFKEIVDSEIVSLIPMVIYFIKVKKVSMIKLMKYFHVLIQYN